MLGLLIPIILIVVFWFLLMRPQQKRQAALRQAQSSLTPGEQVLLTSGVFATVVEVTDDHILVSVAPGVDIRVVRAAIGQVIPQQDPEEVDGEADGEADAPIEAELENPTHTEES